MGLAKDLAKIAKKNQALALEVAQKSFFRTGQIAVNMTPVKTGRAKNNWLSAIGQSDLSVNDGVDSTGGKAVGSLISVVNGLQPGQVMFFTNSLPYIFRLEYESWSAQAPFGMLRQAVLQFPRIAEDEIKKASRK